MKKELDYKYCFLVYLFISIPFLSIGQIDVDSLRSVAEKNYLRIESKPDYFGVVYTKYEDKSGNLVFLIYSKDGVVVDGDNGLNYAISQSVYNGDSKIIKHLTFGADGNFKMGESPPITYYSYDKNGNEIRVDWFDEDNQPVKGSARIEFDYDKKNNRIEKRWFNEKYQLEGETAILRNEYSKKGRLVKISRYDEKGMITEKDNVAYQIMKYKTKNRLVIEEVRFLDQFKKPSEGIYRSKTKFHRGQFEYNQNGKLINIVMFDKDGIEIIN